MVSEETDSRLRLQEMLQRHGIGSRRAMITSNRELSRWEVADVEAVLHQVGLRGHDYNPCGREFNQYRGLGLGSKVFMYSCIGGGFALAIPILIVHSTIRLFKQHTFAVFRQTWNEYGLSNLLALGFDFDRYIKAPLNLVQQSVDQKAALCVNADGNFKVLHDGYSVMSHVWEETMGWNNPEGFGKVDLSLRKKGIHKAHFRKFFDRCGVMWLWMDVLAMPEVLEDMSPQQQSETKALRVGVINNLNSIYRNADKVVVLDSLVLQLKTGSLVDVAVVLCLGRWITRMWTLAEARLGRRVLIKTEDGETDLDEVIALLEGDMLGPSPRYDGLAKTLSAKRGNIPLRTRYDLADLTAAYKFGQTGEAIDNVRSVYPLLDLKWEVGWDERQAVLNLKETLPAESDALSTFCTDRGLPDPFDS
ncbi:monocarboxylate transporter [Colletotrichum graminicola M1.001]|uniref:Monocarboxylate transporter n=1 Tax=Colletotrichum graminicola (strain M1.001 / M2 / FGSC 10212) TaxID=645133 RepID=E3QTP2_COLGM|nr:monocarboxylate transporter [Colletotrichum graminicola M1.001]EFQ34204.1 monocarboxylate transporter [Colletotrichum graminicola M1.001]